MTEIVLIQRDDDIATVVLNRPEKLNALSKALWIGVGEALQEISGDDDVRCIVLRGAGGRAFSPRDDIKEFETERSNVQQARTYGTIMHDTMGTIHDCRHPIIAMINGICVGGG